ncbi:MAG: phosphoribosylaminoimidazole-succinocarboxamide synthase [Acidimicrobiales bacterium]|nr:MAG: phosphoribosylaminoimidazole-succinocarboxamide synthase [Acidimicrobiales bacterium]
MAREKEQARWAIDLPLVRSGKVRDIYRLDDDHLLFVASDRISAFDVVMREPIPNKGRVLTAMSAFWFERFQDLVSHHMVTADPAEMPESVRLPELAGRAMVVREAEMLPIECIVRGHLAGSAWSEYTKTGTVHGTPFPAGLRLAEKLPEPVFTPSTKADEGHDVNISFRQAADIVGTEMAERLRDVSLEIYTTARDMAAQRGIIIADTKFEFGLVDGELVLADEVLTPDSSRFWPADAVVLGENPPSFDKQPLRDWLDESGWDKTPPPPPLPPEVVEATSKRYVEAYERITGLRLEDWPGGESSS